MSLLDHPTAQALLADAEVSAAAVTGCSRRLERFDVVALGRHWGDGTFTPGARPGRTPLGIAVELVPADVAANLVPPQGAGQWEEYLGR